MSKFPKTYFLTVGLPDCLSISQSFTTLYTTTQPKQTSISTRSRLSCFGRRPRATTTAGLYRSLLFRTPRIGDWTTFTFFFRFWKRAAVQFSRCFFAHASHRDAMYIRAQTPKHKLRRPRTAQIGCKLCLTADSIGTYHIYYSWFETEARHALYATTYMVHYSSLLLMKGCSF